jgi:hypothetical protein
MDERHARTASGYEHQGDDAKPRLDPGKIKDGTRVVRGEVRSPSHHWERWVSPGTRPTG